MHYQPWMQFIHFIWEVQIQANCVKATKDHFGLLACGMSMNLQVEGKGVRQQKEPQFPCSYFDTYLR